MAGKVRMYIRSVCDQVLPFPLTPHTLLRWLPNHPGQFTFGVPDLRGRRAAGVGSTYGLAVKYGAETAKLNYTTLAAHAHGTPFAEATTTEGGGAGFDNADLSLALQYIIAVQGTVPVAARRRGLLEEGEEVVDAAERGARQLTTASPWLGEIALFA